MSEESVPASFVSTLQALSDWLETERIPHITIGGVAVSLLAKPRATQDIDAVIWLEENRWEEFLRVGERYGFIPRLSGALEFAAKARVFLLKHQESGISVDISCGALEFEKEMIERAATLAIGPLQLRVPTPEDLIITKAVAHRSKDLIDIETILGFYQNLDLSRIRHWVSEFAMALETPEISENLEKLLERYTR
ncbi:MAG: nucleotidyl transferase AbiEii/AbiGii toxin family protein [Pyrinomonadaceae bacterium]